MNVRYTSSKTKQQINLPRLQFCLRTNAPLPPPSPHKTKSEEGLVNFIVKMLYCRDQADDLIRCIIIIMFEMINSQQEALHHHYEM